MDEVRVREFVLTEPLGRGGMGEVWKGRHVLQDVPVALKLTLATSDESDLALFDEETRLVASLSHPHIVRVLDVGTLEQPIRLGTRTLSEGTPWLAMELAAGGTLTRSGPQSYEEVLHVLSGLLKALAHAHARGIVHRDIKTGNLLLCAPLESPDARPRILTDSRIVLSDFGIARLLAPRDHQDALSGAGTPSYMAPEQIFAAHSSYGPWTDLYQTGVLGWLLATGGYPFVEASRHALLYAHLNKPAPQFEPRIPVPVHFEGWLRWLLEKLPAGRPAFAAEALEELEQLESVGGTRAPVSLNEQPTELSDEGAGGDGIALIEGPAPGRRSPWRVREAPHAGRDVDQRLVGTGTSLVGLASGALRGRDAEKAVLWRHLEQLHQGGQPAWVVLEGQRGVGRSRLMEWLATSAHEAGGAMVVRASFLGDHRDGSTLARSILRLQGEGDPEALRARLHAWLGSGSFSAPTLEAYIQGHPVPPSDVATALGEALRAVARRQPVILAIDDGGDHGVALLSPLLRHLRRRRVSVLLLCTKDVTLPWPEEVDAHRVFVPPLPTAVMGRVVDDHAQLSAELRDALVDGAEGLPGRIVRQLRRWVDASAFRVQGTRLHPVRALEVDDDGDTDLELARVAGFRRRWAPEVFRAVQVAAALGARVDPDDWVAACGALGLSVGSARTRAVRDGVLASDPGGGLHFTTRGLCVGFNPPREVLEAAAFVLQDRGGRSERLAELLLATEAWDQAFDCLHEVACTMLEHREPAAGVIGRCADLAQERGWPIDDERHGQVGLLWAWHHDVLGEQEPCARWAVEVEQAARMYGWSVQLGRALRQRMLLAVRRGDDGASLDLGHQALAEAASREDHLRVAICEIALGDVHVKLGALDVAAEHYSRGVASAERVDHLPSRVQGLLALGQVAIRDDRPEEAMDWLEQARTLAVEHDMQPQITTASNYLGEVYRALGLREEAERHYQRAGRRQLERGSSAAVFPALNLCLMRIQRDAFREALSVLRRLAGPWIDPVDLGVVQVFLQASLLVCGLHTEPDKQHDRLAWLREQLKTQHIVDKDFAYLLDRAGEALADDDPDAARELWTVAETLYLSVGRPLVAAEVRAEIEALG